MIYPDGGVRLGKATGDHRGTAGERFKSIQSIERDVDDVDQMNNLFRKKHVHIIRHLVLASIS